MIYSLSAVSELDRFFPPAGRVQHSDSGEAAAQRHHERLGHRLPTLGLGNADRHGTLSQPPFRGDNNNDDDVDQVRSLIVTEYGHAGQCIILASLDGWRRRGVNIV